MAGSIDGACSQGIDTGFVALGYARVAVLGVVQGLTELLPVSSTAHMRIVPGLLGWQDPGSAFSAAMQLAALAAVVTYYWLDVRGIPTRKDQPRQPDFDKAAYRERNKVERLINRLKRYRRIATRYEKRAANDLAMVTLGMTMLWLT